MLGMCFEWDEQKNSANREKHGITFEEACSVFDDANALLIPDPDHSDDEERFVILGLSNRNNEQTIRIISARKATKTESHFY